MRGKGGREPSHPREGERKERTSGQQGNPADVFPPPLIFIIPPGVVAAIQTFGDRINFHPDLHFLATEGGMDKAGVFHRVPRIDDVRLVEIFTREVLDFLVGRELLSPEWAGRILSWPHTGFSVHSRVRAKTKPEAERVGKYMIRPVLSLERLSLSG